MLRSSDSDDGSDAPLLARRRRRALQQQKDRAALSSSWHPSSNHNNHKKNPRHRRRAILDTSSEEEEEEDDNAKETLMVSQHHKINSNGNRNAAASSSTNHSFGDGGLAATQPTAARRHGTFAAAAAVAAEPPDVSKENSSRNSHSRRNDNESAVRSSSQPAKATKEFREIATAAAAAGETEETVRKSSSNNNSGSSSNNIRGKDETETMVAVSQEAAAAAGKSGSNDGGDDDGDGDEPAGTTPPTGAVRPRAAAGAEHPAERITDAPEQKSVAEDDGDDSDYDNDDTDLVCLEDDDSDDGEESADAAAAGSPTQPTAVTRRHRHLRLEKEGGGDDDGGEAKRAEFTTTVAQPSNSSRPQPPEGSRDGTAPAAATELDNGDGSAPEEPETAGSATQPAPRPRVPLTGNGERQEQQPEPSGGDDDDAVDPRSSIQQNDPNPRRLDSTIEMEVDDDDDDKATADEEIARAATQKPTAARRSAPAVSSSHQAPVIERVCPSDDDDDDDEMDDRSVNLLADSDDDETVDPTNVSSNNNDNDEKSSLQQPKQQREDDGLIDSDEDGNIERNNNRVASASSSSSQKKRLSKNSAAAAAKKQPIKSDDAKQPKQQQQQHPYDLLSSDSSMERMLQNLTIGGGTTHSSARDEEDEGEAENFGTAAAAATSNVDLSFKSANSHKSNRTQKSKSTQQKKTPPPPPPAFTADTTGWLSSRNTSQKKAAELRESSSSDDSDSDDSIECRVSKKKPRRRRRIFAARSNSSRIVQRANFLDRSSSSSSDNNNNNSDDDDDDDSDDAFLELSLSQTSFGCSNNKKKTAPPAAARRPAKASSLRRTQASRQKFADDSSDDLQNSFLSSDSSDDDDSDSQWARKRKAKPSKSKVAVQDDSASDLSDNDDKSTDPNWKRQGRFYKLIHQKPSGGGDDSDGDVDNDDCDDDGDHESSVPPLLVRKDIFRKLYPHQKSGVEWLATLHNGFQGGVLGDDMGMGKTFMTLTFLGALFQTKTIRNALIVAPVSVLSSWEKEAFKVLGRNVQIVVIKSSESVNQCMRILNAALRCSPQNPMVAITSYGMVRSRTQYFRDGKKNAFDYVCLDECHTIKNARSGTSQACSDICKPNHTHRLGLSGTPLMNRLNELWAVFDWATAGRVLGDEATYKRRYSKPIENSRNANATDIQKRIGEQKSRELRNLLVPRHFLQRMKTDYLADKLPSKTDIIVWTHLSEDQRSRYQKFLDEDSLVQDMIRGRVKQSPLTAITELKKLCGHPLLNTMESRDELTDYLEEADDTVVVDELVEQSDKLRLLRDLVEKLTMEGHKTLIFSQSTRMLDIIAKVLQATTIGTHGLRLETGRIDGGTQVSQRQWLVDEFNAADSTMKVMLCSTKAAGVGLTLTGADRAIIYDPSWTPAEDSQAVDRCYRIGQTKPVVVYRMIAAGTVEEKMYEKQVFKDGIRRSVLEEGGCETTERYFDANELRKMFTLGTRGECSVMEKIASYEIPFDTHPHAYILRHGSAVGLSRHDVFYQLAKGLDPPPDAAAQQHFQVMGRSQRVLQDHASNSVALGGGRKKKNQTHVGDFFKPARDAKSNAGDVIELCSSYDDDGGDDDEYGEVCVGKRHSGKENSHSRPSAVIELIESSSDEDSDDDEKDGDTVEMPMSKSTKHRNNSKDVESIASSLDGEEDDDGPSADNTLGVARFDLHDGESRRDSYGVSNDDVKHSKLVDDVEDDEEDEEVGGKDDNNAVDQDDHNDAEPNDNLYADDNRTDKLVAHFIQKADYELSRARHQESLNILLSILDQEGDHLKPQAFRELNQKIALQANRQKIYAQVSIN